MSIEFQKVELMHQDLIGDYLKKHNSRSCETTFANLYLWKRNIGVAYAIVGDRLVIKTLKGDPSFLYPIGNSELKYTLDALMEYCEEEGTEFRMHLVTKEQFELLEEIYPGKFEIEFDRDAADYIYETEKLINLSGRKYHSKKNHVNRFKKEYPDWSYEEITKDNVEECFQMGLIWRQENGCEEDETKVQEMCVTLNSLRLMEELKLRGGLIRTGGKVVAFSIGEPASDDTYVVHIEKALADVQGAYTIMNQQFLEHEAAAYKYVNREEDMGVEGIRKAKLSYKPVFLVEKGKVTVKK